MFNKKRMSGSEVIKKTEVPGSLPYVWKKIRKRPLAMIGLIFVVGLLVTSFISPWICTYSYKAISMREAFVLPSWKHPFGCDELGRDILSRVLYGAKYTMSVGVFSTMVSCVFGVILGAIAGYFGGKVDNFIMRCLDIFQAFPGILLAIALSTALGPGFEKVIIAMGIAFIPVFARMMRAKILSIRGAEYVEAATAMNCSTFRIVSRHIIPNAISPLIVQVAMSIANSGLAASSLSFLGFGVDATTPEWGAMLSTGRAFLRTYPHLCFFPGLFIMASVLSFNLVGDAIRDALDPKLKD